MPINMQIALSPFGSWGGCGSERFRDFSTAIQLANGSQDRNLISKSPGHSFTERCQWTMAWRRNLTHCLMLKMKIYCNTTAHICLHIACDSFGSTTTRLSSCDKDHMVHKPEIFTISPFTEKVCQPMFYGIVMSFKHKNPKPDTCFFFNQDA